MEYITAEDLFQRVGDALTATAPGVANHILHDTLVLCCHEGLRNTRHAFGNLSAQVDYLCRERHVPLRDVQAIQRMRRHSNSDEPLTQEQLGYDCRAMALFISAVFQKAIPSTLTGRIPTEGESPRVEHVVSYDYIRCVVRSFDSQTIQATVVNQDCDEDLLTIDYHNTPDYIDYSYLARTLRKGMVLNLLDCLKENGCVIPGLVIVEPDYLLDISAISSCFEDYGHHPLLFTLNRLKPRANSSPILLGNFAGSALDDIINHTTYRLGDTLQRNFREKAIEYACCPDFNPAAFKAQAQTQVDNMKGIVSDLFSRYDKQKAILEPSFVCEKLGIQGRVDLMTTDLKLLVEQKSGQNTYIQRHTRNRYGSLHPEKHYVQVLLYFGVLSYNFGLTSKFSDIFLLYSKYALPDGLLQVEPLRKLLREALKYRNQVVGMEFWMAEHGFAPLLPHLTTSTLNTECHTDFFFERYLRPQIEATIAPLQSMPPLEKAYFCRMMRFVLREQVVGKVGAQEGVGSAGADLWNMPLSLKRETGNIFTQLRIVEKSASTSEGVFDTLTLSVPKQDDDFLPNFRRGDMVYLYAYRREEQPDVRRNILYKGTLQDITPAQIVVHLNDGQQNPHILCPDDVTHWYCLEHASSDIGGSSAMQALFTFVTSSPARRSLLLGQRAPEADKSLQLSRSYNPTYDEIVQKAKQAKDYFLLIGPPGTGKTSMALQYLVRELVLLPTPEKPQGGNGLLLSYTNRAVDEICGMLTEHGIDFIRLGNAYSCDPKYRPYLLSERLAQQPTLAGIKSLIQQTQLIVATTSTIAARPFIFQVKHFNVAIVDEASQILEPNIVGILGAHTQGQCCIDKFILIGDHKQLPAVVQQDPAESAVDDPLLRDIQLTDCRNSLFERLILTERAAKRDDFIGTLRRQGRMHPAIAAFPNRMFYAREHLEPVPLRHQEEDFIYPLADAQVKLLSPLAQLLARERTLFIPSPSCLRPGVSEKVNTEEARIVAEVVHEIRQLSGEAFDPTKTIGVIVPYRNQIAMIRKALAALNCPQLLQISIDTVERYQGSQRDVIIYSFTIQRRYQLDFLTSNCFVEDEQVIDRKLNVALTRARKQLIVTGNEAILRQDDIFKALIDSMPRHEM